MYYTVYKITNLINKKIYIGCHKTSNLNDGYMGSGKLIIRSIRKYGLENFIKEYLEIFDNPYEMFEMESKIVNENFVSDKLTYNLKIGGNGGWSHIKNKDHKKAFSTLIEKFGENWIYNILTQGIKNKRQNDPIFKEKERQRLISYHKLANTEQSKLKRKNTFCKIKHQQGIKNSQYNKMWITNGIENKKIKREDIIPEGWYKGRIM